jgi:starvation-inducible outer membrane lipoprotein
MQRVGGTRILSGVRLYMGGWMALCLCVFFLAGLSNCVRPISKDVMTTVNQGLTYPVVIENPKAYIGARVRWGGIIEDIVFGSIETRIVVSQTPLDAKGHPQTDVIGGEFIVQTSQILNSLQFKKGLLITVAGDISAVEEKETGATKYLRPVVLAVEIYPWDKKPIF